MTDHIDTAVERDKCSYPSAYPPWARNTVLRLLDALDTERAKVAAAYEAVARWHDETAGHDQGGIDYSDAVGIPISNRHELAQSVKAHTYSAYAIRALTPADAQAALDKMLAEARLEGWRAGREAATEPLTSLAAVLRETENSYHKSQASALLERVDAIRALPEPKETSHD